jgi:hypothetical protein
MQYPRIPDPGVQYWGTMCSTGARCAVPQVEVPGAQVFSTENLMHAVLLHNQAKIRAVVSPAPNSWFASQAD